MDRSAKRAAHARFCGVPVERKTVKRAPTEFSPSARARDRSRARCLRSDLPDEPLARLLNLLKESSAAGANPEMVEARLRLLATRAMSENRPWRLAEVGTILVLADLAGQGWTFAVARDAIWMTPPSAAVRHGETPSDVKARLRAPMEAARKRQLQEPAVRRFLESMRRRRRYGSNPSRATSIADVIDDGKELASKLAAIATLRVEERNSALATLIEPIVEIVTPEGRCKHTGLLLRDIWRYFRHTWSLEYRASPGRNAQFLVRNAARPNAPVMGIASLTNPVLQLQDRDDWVGWTYAGVTKRIARDPVFWPDCKDALFSAPTSSEEDRIQLEGVFAAIDLKSLVVAVRPRTRHLGGDNNSALASFLERQSAASLFGYGSRGPAMNGPQIDQGNTEQRDVVAIPAIVGKARRFGPGPHHADRTLRDYAAHAERFSTGLRYPAPVVAGEGQEEGVGQIW
jgi:hypothetical protein